MPRAYDSHIFLSYCVGNTTFSLLVIYTLLSTFAMQVLSGAALSLAVVGSLCRVTALGVQWAIWSRKPDGDHFVCPKSALSTMQVLFPVLMSLATALRLLSSLCTTDCDELLLDPVNLMCNRYHDIGGISLTLTVELMFTPIIVFSLLRDTRLEGIWLSWAIICAVLLSYTIILRSADIAVATVLYMFASALLCFDSQLRLKKTTALVNQLRDTLAENERLAQEAQAVELRAMIGNIAHDLKSVRNVTYPSPLCCFP